MPEAEKTSRSGKLFWTIIAAVVLVPLAAVSCHHYYSQSVIKAQVDQFCLSTKLLFNEKIEKDQQLNQIRTERLKEALTEYESKAPMLLSAYEADKYAFRFINNHDFDEKHSLLIQRVKGLYNDGVNLAPYQLRVHDKKMADLTDLNKQIDQAAYLVCTEQEKQDLFEALEFENGKKDTQLTPMGILEMVLKPKYHGKFPTIEKAWKDTYALADKRTLLEAGLEAETGKYYFMLLNELMVAQDRFMANWAKFASNPNDAIAEMEPNITHYANLKKALKQYRQYAKAEFNDYNFPAKGGTKIKKGTTQKDLVLRIKKRLAVEGYWSGDMEPVWEDSLTEALTHYQENHQVVPDGVYGLGTAQSFNVPLSTRVNQIRLAMRRIRESGGRWENYYVRINIPQFLLEVRENQKVIRTHRVVVGNPNPKNHTPVFSDEIEKINFNPSWFVPKRIILEEMQPAYDKDENYFQSKGYVAKINDEGKVLSVTQPPGGGNALGNVKILFPNKHDVYLHDTPTKYLFKRTIRPFSHGCMRCQDASELARFLLQKDNHPDVDKVDEYLEKRIHKELELKNHVPVHIEYVLASSNEAGEAIFFGDVYKEEKDVLMAMAEEKDSDI